MKKVFYFLVFMIMIIVTNTGCTKCTDDVVYPVQVASIPDLNGSWEFVNFYVPGYGTYTECTALYAAVPAAVGKSLLLSFDINSSLEICTVKDKCNGTLGTDWKITKNYTIPDLFIFDITDAGLNPKYTFRVDSYDKNTGILKLLIAIDDPGSFQTLTVKKI